MCVAEIVEPHARHARFLQERVVVPAHVLRVQRRTGGCSEHEAALGEISAHMHPEHFLLMLHDAQDRHGLARQ